MEGQPGQPQNFAAKRQQLLQEIAKEMEEAANHSNKLKATLEKLAEAEGEVTRISSAWADFHKEVIQPKSFA